MARLSRLHEQLSPEVTASLLNPARGYAVVDGFLGAEWSAALLASAQSLASQKVLAQHRFEFGGAVLSKPGIFELDLHDEARRRCSDELQYLHSEAGLALAAALRRALAGTELRIREGGTSVSAIKLQLNTGEGGCFPLHYDNPGPPCRRVLTAIVYLNPSWVPGHGGELVLRPFLRRAVVVPPLMDRLVLFRSDRVLHRVLPARAVRYCCSIWFDGADGAVNRDDDVNLKTSHLRFTSWDEAEAFFQASPLQRVISRAVHAELYRDSLLECLVCDGESAAAAQQAAVSKAVVASHEGAVAATMAKLRPLCDQLRARLLDLEPPEVYSSP